MNDDSIFDTAAALERVDQDRELLQELCQMFFADSDRAIAKLCDSVQGKRDLATAREEAHAIKSALGNLGAMVAYRSAQRLEMACKSDQLDVANAELQMLSAAIKEFRESSTHFFSN